MITKSEICCHAFQEGCNISLALASLLDAEVVQEYVNAAALSGGKASSHVNMITSWKQLTLRY
jgi:hypothetical protein